VTKIVDFYEEGRMQWQKAYLMFFMRGLKFVARSR